MTKYKYNLIKRKDVETVWKYNSKTDKMSLNKIMFTGEFKYNSFMIRSTSTEDKMYCYTTYLIKMVHVEIVRRDTTQIK